jgi:hypothetical protein
VAEIGPVVARLEVEDIAITARTGTVRLHGNRPRPTSPITTAMATTAKAAAATVVTRFPAGRNAFSTPDSPAHQAFLNYPSSSPPIRWVVIDGEPVPGSGRGPAAKGSARLPGRRGSRRRSPPGRRADVRSRAAVGCSACASEPSRTTVTCMPRPSPRRPSKPTSARPLDKLDLRDRIHTVVYAYENHLIAPRGLE